MAFACSTAIFHMELWAHITIGKHYKHYKRFSGDIEEIFLSSAGGKVRDIFNTHLVQLEMN